MNVQDNCIGAIELINKKGSDGLFSEPDLMMSQTLAAAAALALRNARMAEKLVKQERVNREIELAIEMQRSLLPKPRTDSFPVCGINLPAHEMSGDFYDYFDLEDGRICFSLGDVSGKGMDAALLMSKTASLFHCLGKTIQEPNTLLVTINKELCETAFNGMFVTMVCGIYNPVSGATILANAGHEPPLIHTTDGNFTSLPASSPPLGILPLVAGGDGIINESFRLNGGTLYIFTDGVTEGELGNGRRLEVGGFREIIRAHEDEPATGRISAVIKRLQDSSEQRHDDITLLAVDDLANRPHDMTSENPAKPLVRLKFRAHAGELQRVREAVRTACEQSGCSEALTRDLVIAVGEAGQNIVRHAYKDVEAGEATLEILQEKGILEFRLLDSAPPVNREKMKPVWPEEVKPGGLGVCLIHDIMDKVEYLDTPSGKGNLLRMVKFTDSDSNET